MTEVECYMQIYGQELTRLIPHYNPEHGISPALMARKDIKKYFNKLKKLKKITVGRDT